MLLINTYFSSGKINSSGSILYTSHIDYINEQSNFTIDMVYKKYNFDEYINILDKYNLLTIPDKEYGINLIKNTYETFYNLNHLKLAKNIHIKNNEEMDRPIALIIFLFKNILKCNFNKYYIYSNNNEILTNLNFIALNYEYKPENITLDLHIKKNLMILIKPLMI